MTKPWILVDVQNLAWRSFFSTGTLSHGGDATGVLYGVMREIAYLKDRFLGHFAFCFDLGVPKRRELYPTYKANRTKTISPDQRKEVHEQITSLREEVLPYAGFANLLAQDGYEADDLIGSLVGSLGKDRHVIVSNDKDLYQLLRLSNRIYRPGTKDFVTLGSFTSQYRIGASDWALVKAIAGCASDNIIGIDGVGETRACSHVRRELGQNSKAYDNIRNHPEIIARNLKLTSLPFPGTDCFVLRKDKVTQEKWREICLRFGMKSLADTRV